MNPTDTSADGYPASEMRKYLIPIQGISGSGKFLVGLENAGVPGTVLWAPMRHASTIEVIGYDVAWAGNDALWLPTEREMFGSQTHSGSLETADNQARLEYYDTETKRIKHSSANPAQYWLASQLPSLESFCAVESSGDADKSEATGVGGVAPAFCVW
jgi:hypothetical protein